LLFYLLITILVNVAVFMLIYVHLSDTRSLEPIKSSVKSKVALHSTGALPWLGSELGFIVILTGGLAIIAGFGYIWYRIASLRLERPVRVIQKALNQLARGQLNETVAMEAPDEFGQIGSGINELAANLQELLLYIWKQTGQCQAWLEHIQNNPDLHHDRRLTLESLGYLKQLSDAIVDLREMAKSYVFYDVSLDNDQAQAINTLGQRSSSK
jgi:methyl-accepting chemotaxis protein